MNHDHLTLIFAAIALSGAVALACADEPKPPPRQPVPLDLGCGAGEALYARTSTHGAVFECREGYGDPRAADPMPIRTPATPHGWSERIQPQDRARRIRVYVMTEPGE